MTVQHPFPYYRSPAEIREIEFTRRIRGVDEYEVAEFLDLLADQVHTTNLELTRITEENERLKTDNARLQAQVAQLEAAPPPVTTPDVTPRAAALLLNAERIADELVEEAVRRARDMLTVARAEKRAILRKAQEEADALLAEAREVSPVSRIGRARSWQLDGNPALPAGL